MPKSKIIATELRVGNLVYQYGKPHKITLSNINGFLGNENYTGGRKKLRPIPLDIEWMNRLGAKRIDHIHGYSFWTFNNTMQNPICLDIQDDMTTFNGRIINHCESVHKLQNIYFILTGREMAVRLT